MATTDAERAQLHAQMMAEWERLRAGSTTPGEALTGGLPAPEKAPLVKAPVAPPEPTPPTAAELARDIRRRLPFWAFGEKAAAKQIGAQQAAHAAEQARRDHDAALEHHARELETYEARKSKRLADYAIEAELVEGILTAARGGDQAAIRYLLAQAIDLLPYDVEVAALRGRELVVVVDDPGVEDVPDREPTHTAAGKPTTRKLNKTQRNDAHASAVAERVAGAACVAARIVPDGVSITAQARDADGRVVARYQVDDAAKVRTQLPKTLADKVSVGRAGAAGNVVAID